MAGYAVPAMADQVKPAWSGATEELFQTFVVDEGLKELGYDVADLTQVQVQLAHTAVLTAISPSIRCTGFRFTTLSGKHQA
ncbi:MAG: hypothetical protein E5X69_26920, partial [Mesorhizobium sp.]